MRSPSSEYLYGKTSTFGTRVYPEPRRQRDEDCLTCARYTPGEMYPPHDASPHCESGKRNHCTCDTCF